MGHSILQIKSNLSRGAVFILGLPRIVKRIVVSLLDAALCASTVWIAYYLRLGEVFPLGLQGQGDVGFWRAVSVSILTGVPIFMLAGLYRAVFRHSGWPALITVIKAVSIYGAVYAFILSVYGVGGVPGSVGLIQPVLLLIFVSASRALACAWLGDRYLGILRRAAAPRALIYGAGGTGRQLAAALADSPEMQVVGFLDDDPQLQSRVLNGHPVYSPCDLAQLVSTSGVSLVLLALPNITSQRRTEILNRVRSAHVLVRSLPNLTELAKGKVRVSDSQEPDIDALLCRETVLPDASLLARHTRDKVVLVTGAGGSIGRELCMQILAAKPSKLLLIEQSEFALYSIHQRLEASRGRGKTALVPLLASVQNAARIGEIMSTWRPDTVYHAAAYKHVPLVEHNPAEGIRNNVFGTLQMALAAVANKVGHFVLVSTDKAVRPTNMMGASKRLAEVVLKSLSDSGSSTIFSIVRFGNVLGSSGSVVPKFFSQIQAGGPITLTHPEVTRYFMTPSEAAQLVIQAGAMGTGGDIFILDMGEPVRIRDLARRMVHLSGLSVRDELNPEGDISFEITGLRLGEKLHEELLIREGSEPTGHPRILRAREDYRVSWEKLALKLQELEESLNTPDAERIRSKVRALVDGYEPGAEIVDWVYLEQESTDEKTEILSKV